VSYQYQIPEEPKPGVPHEIPIEYMDLAMRILNIGINPETLRKVLKVMHMLNHKKDKVTIKDIIELK
jgi:hypothetical protein